MANQALQEEWQVISQAPWTSASIVVALVAFLWFFINWMRSQEVSGLKAQVESWKAKWELAKDQVAVIEKKHTELQSLNLSLGEQIKRNASAAQLKETSDKIELVTSDIVSANNQVQEIYHRQLVLHAEPGHFTITIPPKQ